MHHNHPGREAAEMVSHFRYLMRTIFPEATDRLLIDPGVIIYPFLTAMASEKAIV